MTKIDETNIGKVKSNLGSGRSKVGAENSPKFLTRKTFSCKVSNT